MSSSATRVPQGAGSHREPIDTARYPRHFPREIVREHGRHGRSGFDTFGRSAPPSRTTTRRLTALSVGYLERLFHSARRRARVRSAAMPATIRFSLVATYDDVLYYNGQSVDVVCNPAVDPGLLSRDLRRVAANAEDSQFHERSWRFGVFNKDTARQADVRPASADQRTPEAFVSQWFVSELTSVDALVLVGEWSSVELACSLINCLADWIEHNGIPASPAPLVALDLDDELNEALWPPSNELLSDSERERRAHLLRRNGFDPTEYGYR